MCIRDSPFSIPWCTWRQVVVDDVVRDMPDQNHLESGQAVVAQRPTDEDPVLLPEFPDLDAVVENNRSVGRIL